MSQRDLPTATDNRDYERPLVTLAICMSLACLQYLNMFHAVQDSYSNEARYFTFEGRGYSFELSLILNVLFVGSVLFFVDRFFR